MKYFNPFFVLLCFLILPANAQNYLYVDTLVGSDSLSGTARAVDFVAKTGPKATIEGAIRAAPEGMATAIYLLSSSYTRDESSMVDASGIQGGNDADGITISGDKTIHLIIAHPREVVFSSPLEINVLPGRSVQIRDDIGELPANCTLEEGFVLESGTLEWDVGVRQEIFLGGASVVGAGTQFIVDDRLQLENSSLHIENGGRLELRTGARLGETGVITNAGSIISGLDIVHTWNGASGTPLEESHTYLVNESTGRIDMASSDMFIGGIGIHINRGTIRSGMDGFPFSDNRISGYFYNLGTLEIQSGDFLLGDVRTALGEEEGGRLFLGPDTELEVDFLRMSPSSRFEGEGLAWFRACTFEGAMDYYGELFLNDCQFTDTAQITSLGSEVQIDNEVYIQSTGSLSIDKLRFSSIFSSLFLGPDLVVDELQMSGLLSGPGTLTVNSYLDWRAGTLDGPGNVVLKGSGVSSRASMNIRSELVLADSSSFVFNVSEIEGTGRLRVREGARMEIAYLFESPATDTLTIANEGTIVYTSRDSGTLVSHVDNYGFFSLGTGGLDRVLALKGRFTNQPVGTLTGGGTLDITGARFVNQGFISPGEGGVLQQLNVIGNLDLSGSTRTVFDVWSRPDLIHVDGSVHLGGALDIQFPTDRFPQLDFSEPLLTYSSVSGAFEAVDIQLPERYSDATAVLESREDTLMLVFSGYNVAPIAVDDSLTISEGDTAFIDVLANDFDALGDPIFPTVSLTSKTRVFDNGTPGDRSDDLIQYTPPPDFNGEDRFIYRVWDEKDSYDTGSVVVNVVAKDDSVLFSDYPLLGGSVGIPYEHLILARDVDDPEVVLTADELPSWLTFTDNNEPSTQKTGWLRGTPGEEDTGVHLVRVAGTSASGTFFHEFEIVILPDANLQPPFDAEVDDFTPTMTWNPLSGAASYRFQLGQLNVLNDGPPSLQRALIDSLGITQTEFTIPRGILRSRIPYEWRVGYLSEEGVLTWSGINVFSIPEQGPLPTPDVLAPLNGASSVPLPIAFEWEKVAGNQGYRIEISADSTFSAGVQLLGGRDDIETAIGSTNQLVGGELYYWRVAAINEAGGGAWSTVRSFTAQPVSHVISDLIIPSGDLYAANYDGDFDYDLLVVSRDTIRTDLYIGAGGTFELMAHETGLPEIMGTAAWADYDADGDPDLVLAGLHASGSVQTQIYELNEGVFTLAPFELPPVRNTAIWGRFDLDFDLDLILSDINEQGDGTTYVMERKGNGFETAHLFDIGGVVELVDYDRDGDQDILVAAGLASVETGVRIYRNDRDSLEMVLNIVDFKAGGTAFADYDVDGDLDVVITGRKGEEATTLFYTFEANGFAEADHPFDPSDQRPSWSDIDHDSYFDLFIPASEGSSLPPALYMNTGGAFVPNLLTGLEGIDIDGYAWIDTNFDYDRDLVISGRSASGHVLQIREKVVEGASGRLERPGTAEVLTSTKHSITFGWDMAEQEGRSLDLMNYIVVVRSVPGGQLLSPIHIPADNSSPRLFISGAANAGPERQFTVTGLSPDSLYTVQVHAVDAYDNIGHSPFDRRYGTSQFSSVEGLTGVDESLFAPSDLDGDGDVDAFKLVDPRDEDPEWTFFQQDEGRFLETEQGLGLFSVISYDIADYDNDNDLDILTTGPGNSWGVFLNEDGFSSQRYMELGQQSNRVFFWWDFDLDNDLDVVAAWQDELFVYKSDAGEISPFPEVVDIGFSLGGGLFPGDYDNDGDLDFYASGQHFSGVIRNDNGRFAPTFSGVSDKTSGAAAWGDYDNDGDLDLVTSERVFNQGRLHLYENQDGLLTSKMLIGEPGDGGEVVWGDLDNDGDLDLLTPGNYEGSVFFNDGDEFIKQENAFYADFGGQVIQNGPILQDIDGDHDVDLIYRDFVLRNRPGGSGNEPPQPPQELNVEILDNGTKARLTWDAGSDDTTPAAALTYNVRVGNEPGKGNVISPMSILEGPREGWRMRHGYGNAGKRREFVVHNLEPGITYYWGVQAQDNSFAGGPFSEEIPFTTNGISTGLSNESEALTYDLFQNYPNPFNPTTTLRFSIPEAAEVELDIYDILGRRVAQLVQGSLSPGFHEVQWLADNYASGLYFARMKAKDYTEVVKMVLVK